MIVVSDTSPLTNLAAVGQLDLLPAMYGEVVIPPAVYDELVAGGPVMQVVVQAAWLRVQAVRDSAAVQQLLDQLDLGESEAIVLAQEVQAGLLLIDERKGRQVATQMGLDIVGLVGVLARAKERGLLRQLRPVLDDLVNRANFRISRDLYQFILAQVNE